MGRLCVCVCVFHWNLGVKLRSIGNWHINALENLELFLQTISIFVHFSFHEFQFHAVLLLVLSRIALIWINNIKQQQQPQNESNKAHRWRRQYSVYRCCRLGKFFVDTVRLNFSNCHAFDGMACIQHVQLEWSLDRSLLFHLTMKNPKEKDFLRFPIYEFAYIHWNQWVFMAAESLESNWANS